MSAALTLGHREERTETAVLRLRVQIRWRRSVRIYAKTAGLDVRGIMIPEAAVSPGTISHASGVRAADAACAPPGFAAPLLAATLSLCRATTPCGGAVGGLRSAAQKRGQGTVRLLQRPRRIGSRAAHANGLRAHLTGAIDGPIGSQRRLARQQLQSRSSAAGRRRSAIREEIQHVLISSRRTSLHQWSLASEFKVRRAGKSNRASLTCRSAAKRRPEARRTCRFRRRGASTREPAPGPTAPAGIGAADGGRPSAPRGRSARRRRWGSRCRRRCRRRRLWRVGGRPDKARSAAQRRHQRSPQPQPRRPRARGGRARRRRRRRRRCGRRHGRGRRRGRRRRQPGLSRRRRLAA